MAAAYSIAASSGYKMKLSIFGEKLLISQRFFGIPSLPFLSAAVESSKSRRKQPRFAATLSVKFIDRQLFGWQSGKFGRDYCYFSLLTSSSYICYISSSSDLVRHNSRDLITLPAAKSKSFLWRGL